MRNYFLEMELVNVDEENGSGLCLSQDTADKLYSEAGEEVDEPDDEISMLGHEHLLNDPIDLLIMEKIQILIRLKKYGT